MISTIALLSLVQTWTAIPTDDVWVYPHNSSIGVEDFLRVWGDGDHDIDADGAEAGEVSYGFLNFNFKEAPKTALKTASLTVYALANEDLTEAVIKNRPLSAYKLTGKLDEKKFAFGSKDVVPVAKAKYGSVTGVERVDGYYKLTIDLLAEKSDFMADFKSSHDSNADNLGICLASTISPQDSKGSIYKVVAKDGDKERRPTLTMTFDDN